MIRRRQAITRRAEKEQALKDRLAPFVKGKTVAAYQPVRGEAAVWQPGWLLPVTDPETKTMRFATGPLRSGAWGIPEPDPATAAFVSPEDIDVILVPMVAFCGLHRMGYGQGFYDRYLRRTKALKIGIAFACQEPRFEPAPWDVDMDMVITNTGIYPPVYNETRDLPQPASAPECQQTPTETGKSS